MTLWQNITYKVLHTRSRLFLLIAINVAVFLVINIPALFEQLFLTGLGQSHMMAFSQEYLAMPASLPKLVTHFWTPITYMFMHAGIFHILFNMLWLYWLGQILEEYLGYTHTVKLYLFGGLAGAFLYLLAFNTIPAFTVINAGATSSIVGASAGVMAIIVATATLLPNYTMRLLLFGSVKLKWLVTFYIIIDILGFIGTNAGGSIAHIGGALMGFFYIKNLKSGNNLFALKTKIFKPKSKLKVVVNQKDQQRDQRTRVNQDEIDRILDKISHSGYDKLTKQEKETLFKASNDEG